MGGKGQMQTSELCPVNYIGLYNTLQNTRIRLARTFQFDI